MDPDGTREARDILLFGWDGGGNVPPLLALGKHLARRGSRVRMVGTETMGERAAAAGIAFSPFTRAPSWAPRPGVSLEDEMEDFVAHLLGPELGEELLHAVDASAPDALVVDCMAGGALSAAEHLGIPVAVLVHLRARFHHDLPSGSERSRPARESLNRQRVRLGLDALPIEDNWWPHLWGRAGEVFIAGPPELEGTGAPLPVSFTYVGGLSDPEPPELPCEVAELLIRAARPLVVASLSTTYMHQEQQLATLVDALGGLAAVITTGSGIDPRTVPSRHGIVVTRWAPHESLLPLSDVVVTHAGHGTVVAALAGGVPLVCLPMGRDQHGNADQVVRLGAGVSIDATSGPAEVRAAVDEVLSDAAYRDRAAELAASMRRLGGGVRLADEVESLADRGHRSAGSKAFSRKGHER